jgi:hypothetical protein
VSEARVWSVVLFLLTTTSKQPQDGVLAGVDSIYGYLCWLDSIYVVHVG